MNTSTNDSVLWRAIAQQLDHAERMERRAEEVLLELPRYLGLPQPGWNEWPEIKLMARRLIRQCKRDFKEVERHRRMTWGPEAYLPEDLEDMRDKPFCSSCRADEWPCPTMRDLAIAYELIPQREL